MPFTNPHPAPTRSVTTIPRTTFVSCITRPPAMAATAAMPPTERSIPAVRMTKVWPMAMIPTAVTCQRTLRMLPSVKKFSAKMLNTAQSSSSAPSMATSTR